MKELTILWESLCAGGFFGFLSSLCTESLIFLCGRVVVRSTNTQKEKGSQHLESLIILPLHFLPYLLELIDCCTWFVPDIVDSKQVTVWKMSNVWGIPYTILYELRSQCIQWNHKLPSSGWRQWWQIFWCCWCFKRRWRDRQASTANINKICWWNTSPTKVPPNTYWVPWSWWTKRLTSPLLETRVSAVALVILVAGIAVLVVVEVAALVMVERAELVMVEDKAVVLLVDSAAAVAAFPATVASVWRTAELAITLGLEGVAKLTTAVELDPWEWVAKFTMVVVIGFATLDAREWFAVEFVVFDPDSGGATATTVIAEVALDPWEHDLELTATVVIVVELAMFETWETTSMLKELDSAQLRAWKRKLRS